MGRERWCPGPLQENDTIKLGEGSFSYSPDDRCVTLWRKKARDSAITSTWTAGDSQFGRDPHSAAVEASEQERRLQLCLKQWGARSKKKKKEAAQRWQKRKEINLIIFNLRKRCGENGFTPLAILTADGTRCEETQVGGQLLKLRLAEIDVYVHPAVFLNSMSQLSYQSLYYTVSQHFHGFVFLCLLQHITAPFTLKSFFI